VIKDAGGDTEPFTFGGSFGSIQVAQGTPWDSGSLNPGGYAVTEQLSPDQVAAGWQLSAATCSDGSDPGAISLAANETVTCTFVNVRVAGPAGSLTIIKQTTPAGGEGFGFDAGSLGTFTLDDGGSLVFNELAAGAYTVSESAADGWTFTGVECIAGDWAADGASVTVNLGEGEAAVCTFTNGPEELPFTGAERLMLPLLIAGLWALATGLSMLLWSWRKGAAAQA